MKRLLSGLRSRWLLLVIRTASFVPWRRVTMSSTMRLWNADRDIFDELIPEPKEPPIHYEETGAERFMRLRERYSFMPPCRQGRHPIHRGSGC
jgi:hypothetical protein